MFVDFFIRRPIFATVCALMIILAGAVAIPTLPVAQFPTLAPPQVTVSSFYTGANAQAVETSVTTPIEQQINGVEGMRYMTSSSGNDGSSAITVTFDVSRNIDLAAVDVQNRVNAALGRLPVEVRTTGINVTKSAAGFVFAAGVYTEQGEYDSLFLSNYLDVYVRDAKARPRRGQRHHLRRKKILHALVAGPGAAGRAQPDGHRRLERPAGAERPSGRRRRRPAAFAIRPGVSDQRASRRTHGRTRGI